MSQLRVFSLIGDSNVQRHMNPTNVRDRPLMETAKVIPCTRVESFRTCLSSVAPESTVCILSCITNFLTASVSSDNLSLRVDPIVKDFFAALADACSADSARQYLVFPPMYRRSPLWYRDGLSEVLTRFSSSYQKLSIPNLHLMPSFATPAFESDGVHLNAYSGLEFVLHLFDSSIKLLDGLDNPQARESLGLESTRVLGDRVVALEQGLLRLSSDFDIKYAIDAELHDFRANERLEDSFVITGLRAIQSGLTGKIWQDRAKADVQKIVRELLGREAAIVVVHNVTGRSPGSEVSYTVKMENVEDSRSIRSKFGSFFAGGEDRRPGALSSLGISNCVTRETRVRIAILKLYGQRYKDANPGSRVQVIGYQPRPLLKLTPPSDSGDRRVQTYNFIEAVQKLRSDFSPEETSPLIKKYGQRFRGKLKQLFVVLSDDLIPPSTAASGRPRGKRGASPSGSGPETTRPRVN